LYQQDLFVLYCIVLTFLVFLGVSPFFQQVPVPGAVFYSIILWLCSTQEPFQAWRNQHTPDMRVSVIFRPWTCHWSYCTAERLWVQDKWTF